MVATLDFDRILYDIGQFGKFQIGCYILLNLMVIPTGMHHLAQVFLAGSMDYWCVDDLSDDSMNDTCTTANGTLTCSSWEYDRSVFTSTLVSEYDLVCDRTWLQALSQSFYMFGVMVGVVGFGALADRFGRLKILMLTTVMLILLGTATAFMPNYWCFIVTRLFVGALAGGNMTTVFVMSMEMIGGKARTLCGLLVQGFFATGVMLTSLIAYFITDFRHFQLAISLVYVLFLGYYWIIPESVRWQLSAGHIEEAEKGIRQIAKINNRPIPQNLDEYRPKLDSTDTVIIQGTLLDLYRTPNLRKKTLILQFIWFVNSSVYYGISLLSSEMAGNIYVNACMSGMTELLAAIVFGPFTEKFGRKCTMSFCMISGAIICLTAIPVPSSIGILRTFLAMFGKFLISGSFAIVYVFSAEIFPTVVRNVGVGNGSMCARVGGLVAPFISLLSKVWKPLPFIVFGSSAFVAGLLSLLLPETLHKRLPDTIEEGEEFGKNQKFSCFDRNRDTASHAREAREMKSVL